MSHDFSLILDEHLKRISDIHKIIFVGAQPEFEGQNLYENSSLDAFLAEQGTTLLYYDLEQLGQLKDALREASETLSNMVLVQNSPKEEVLEAFLQFDRLSNEMIFRLNRLEHAHTQEDSGVDPVTGFRTQQVLFTDLTRELSACARRNDFLCVALGRIDGYDALKEKLGKEVIQKVLVDVSLIFKRALRLYDDAYRLPGGKFFVALKQTDKMGAVAAIDRFVELLEQEIYLDFIKEPFISTLDEKVTLSFVITEVDTQENTEQLFKNLNSDLDAHMNEKALALEYLDISEVEKYAKSLQSQ
jgi:diguanylate cyclase (GGDEF)-like protein